MIITVLGKIVDTSKIYSISDVFGDEWWKGRTAGKLHRPKAGECPTHQGYYFFIHFLNSKRMKVELSVERYLRETMNEFEQTWMSHGMGNPYVKWSEDGVHQGNILTEDGVTMLANVEIKLEKLRMEIAAYIPTEPQQKLFPAVEFDFRTVEMSKEEVDREFENLEINSMEIKREKEALWTMTPLKTLKDNGWWDSGVLRIADLKEAIESAEKAGLKTIGGVHSITFYHAIEYFRSFGFHVESHHTMDGTKTTLTWK